MFFELLLLVDEEYLIKRSDSTEAESRVFIRTNDLIADRAN